MWKLLNVWFRPNPENRYRLYKLHRNHNTDIFVRSFDTIEAATMYVLINKTPRAVLIDSQEGRRYRWKELNKFEFWK